LMLGLFIIWMTMGTFLGSAQSLFNEFFLMMRSLL
jgi:hypothetical protein